MREYIKIIESDRASDESDALYAREKNVETVVRHVFEKLGLEISYHRRAVSFDGHERTCAVMLEGNVPLEALSRLMTTGIGTGFKLNPASDFIIVEFAVAEDMEHAVPV